MPRSPGRSRAGAALLAAAVALAACAPRVPRADALRLPTLGSDVAAVRGAVTAFIVGEAAGERRVDTLLASGADFVVDGVFLEHPPRLAGVPGPGTGAVNDLQIQLAGDYAWVVAGYAWVGNDPAGAERGLATFVLERRSPGWRIRHVHSSHVERWSR